MKQIKATQQIHDRLERRKRDRRFGLGMLIVGFLVLMDSPYPFPIPLVGLSSVILSTGLLVWALIRLYRGCRLPLQEAVLFVYHCEGEALRSEILDALEGEEGNGDQLFRVLEKKDLLMPASNSLELVELRQDMPEELMILLPEGIETAKKLLQG